MLLQDALLLLFRRLTPVAGFSHDFDADVVGNNENDAGAGASDAHQHDPDAAARKHADRPRSTTGHSIWGLFGRDKGPSEVEQTSAGTTSAEANDVKACAEAALRIAPNTDGAAASGNLAHTDESERRAEALQSEQSPVSRTWERLDNGHVTEPRPEKARGTVTHPDDAATLQENNPQDYAVPSINEQMDKLNLDDADRERDYSDSSSQGVRDTRNKREEDNLFRRQGHKLRQQSDDSFSSSQFWRTPLVLPDDIEDA